MSLNTIKSNLEIQNIFFSEGYIFDYPSVMGYEKKFRWAWMATQLNTFIVASDLGEEEVTVDLLESHLGESFGYAKKNYNGWPRGLQSGLGVISILVSTKVSEAAKRYCENLASGKKWAGFTIPVVIEKNSGTVYSFNRKPMWGRIYYPHFEEMIKNITGK